MNVFISEIFTSLQGETARAGYVSVFVRFAGCNLKCRYCDTEYSRSGGCAVSVDEIVSRVKNAGYFDHVTITGGEPLYQEGAGVLAQRLLNEGFRVRIETNGSFDISAVPPPVERIADVKTPSSGYPASFNMANIPQLNEHDEIKFVVSDRNDLDFTAQFCRKYLKDVRSVVNISPAAGAITLDECASFIIKELPSARMSIQLHKIIWPKGEPR